MSDWTKALSEALQDKTEKVPKGFKRREEIEKAMGLGSAQTGKALKVLLESKKAERQCFRVMTAGGVKSIPHYRLI